MDHHIQLALDSVVDEHVHQIEIDSSRIDVAKLKLDQRAKLLGDEEAGAELENTARHIHIPVGVSLREAFGGQGLVKLCC